MQRLPKRVQWTWVFRILTGALFWLALLLVAVVVDHLWMRVPTWGIKLIIAAALVVTIGQLLLVPYRYRYYRFQVNETDVEIQKGFFFRHHIAIPIARVQNVDLSQGPFLIWQKLYQVEIDTGGSHHQIEALTQAHAEQLKKRVMQLAMEAKNAQ